MMPETTRGRNARVWTGPRQIPRNPIPAPLHPIHLNGMIGPHGNEEARRWIRPTGFEFRSWPDGRASPACEPLNCAQGSRSMTIISPAPSQGNGQRVRASMAASQKARWTS
jgi:hypothetical protein